jgi:hypothetical protein
MRRIADNAITAIKQARSAPVQEPVAQAWDEGYRAGIDDERMSEASIGIAGFDAKVCEEIYTGEEACGDWPTPEMCATAIRARGNA